MAKRIGGKQLVIAFFDNPAAGEVVARTLMGHMDPPRRPGVVGVLALDSRGKVASSRLGDRAAEDGPGIGAVLGVIALALSGDVLPEQGPLFDARSDLSTDDVARFSAELEAGQAAVAVLEPRPQAERAVVELAELGGKTEVHSLTATALRQAAQAPVIHAP